jgi:hypothetical protein
MPFLGLPLPLWSLLCLTVAAVWVFIWPNKKTQANRVQHFILRWFHALVWVFLAAAAFIAGVDAGLAEKVALLSLLTYGVFMFTTLTTK